jgi:hypothetical protein
MIGRACNLDEGIMLGCGHTECEFKRLLVKQIRAVFARTYSYDEGVCAEYDCMQLVSREQRTVTAMNVW